MSVKNNNLNTKITNTFQALDMLEAGTNTASLCFP